MAHQDPARPLCTATNCNKVQRSFQLGLHRRMLHSMDQTPHILVIDDEPHLSTLIQHYLTLPGGYEVLTENLPSHALRTAHMRVAGH